MNVKRPGRDELYISIAKIIAKRSTCKRAEVGCVLTSDGRMVATGYNGSPAGTRHCIVDGCIMFEGHCRRSIHAEVNAVLHLEHVYESLVCYSTHEVCWDCLKILYTAGVRDIVYLHPYGDDWVRINRIEVFPNLEVERYNGKII